MAEAPAEAAYEPAASSASPPPPPPASDVQRPVAVPLPLPIAAPITVPDAEPRGLEAAPGGGVERSFSDASLPDAAPRIPERRFTSRVNTLRPPPAYLRPPPGVGPVMIPMALSASLQLPQPMPPAAAYARAAEEARRAGVPTFAAAMTWPMPYYAPAEPYAAAPPGAAMMPPLPLVADATPLAQLCRFWAAGNCAAGGTCRFWHADVAGPPWSGVVADPFSGHHAPYPYPPWAPPPFFVPFAPHQLPPPALAAAPPRLSRRAAAEEALRSLLLDEDATASAQRKAERAAVRQRRQATTPCKFYFGEGCVRAVCRFSHDTAPPPA